MSEVEQVLNSLGDVQSVFRSLQKEITKLEEKAKKEKERGDRFLHETKIMRSKMQYYDKLLSANDNYRAEIKTLKAENGKLLAESNRYKRTLETVEKKFMNEQEKRVKETNQLKRKLNNLEHDKPVKRKASVRNGRSNSQSEETPYKASTKVGKREMVIGYFATAELAKQAEEKARGIL